MRLPGPVSAEAVAAAAEADNRVHRWPLTPRISRGLRTRGAKERLAGFEADRAVLGVASERDPRGDLVMTASGPGHLAVTGL